MKIGDRLECIRSCDMTYTVGETYVVEGFDDNGHPILLDNYGDLSDIGQPLNGRLWSFMELE